jgi:hypothetical protein
MDTLIADRTGSLAAKYHAIPTDRADTTTAGAIHFQDGRMARAGAAAACPCDPPELQQNVMRRLPARLGFLGQTRPHNVVQGGWG